MIQPTTKSNPEAARPSPGAYFSPSLRRVILTAKATAFFSLAACSSPTPHFSGTPRYPYRPQPVQPIRVLSKEEARDLQRTQNFERKQQRQARNEHNHQVRRVKKGLRKVEQIDKSIKRGKPVKALRHAADLLLR